MSLLDFGIKYFSHHFKNEMPDFHRELVHDLESLGPDDSISRIAPRGSAKSTWATLIYPIWKTVYRLKRYIILLGDTQPNASKFLDNIRREFEVNEELRNDFPHCRPGTVWRAEAIELTSGTLIEALCYGKGKIRGRRFGHYRPDLIIIDDPQNADDALSPELLEKDAQWLQSDVMNAGEPGTNYILIGTALVDECLVLQHNNRPKWIHKTYKSLIAEPKNMDLWLQWWDIMRRHDDPDKVEKAKQWYLDHKSGEGGMDHGAIVLWPDRVPLEELMLKRFMNPRAFASEQQGEPMPPGDAEWPLEYFDWPGFWFDEWPVDVTLSAFALDPSKGGESKKGDFQALGKGVRNRAGVIFIEAWLEKMDGQSLMDFAVDRWVESPGEAFALETNCFQELLKIPLEKSVLAKNASLRLPLVEIVNTVKKEVRIRRHTPYLASRQYRFRNTPGTRLLVEQLKKFPYAEHDDGGDMLEMLLRVLIQLSHVKRIV